jgi:uncharacterized membrane protein YeaQ/YmgE (transglycosylase-associated protein family)
MTLSGTQTERPFGCYHDVIGKRQSLPFLFESKRAMHLSNENLLVIILVGLFAGWLAGQVMRGSGFGLVGDLIVGLLGALVGDWLLPRLNIFVAPTGHGVGGGHVLQYRNTPESEGLVNRNRLPLRPGTPQLG